MPERLSERLRVYLGSDHAGYRLKSAVLQRLTELGLETVDVGPRAWRDGDDYPPQVMETARRTVADHGSLGVVIGGSGNCAAMAANKIPGCRAALAWSEETARLGRAHDDANVVSIGARMHPVPDAVRFVETFLRTPFGHGERQVRRIAMLTAFEIPFEIPFAKEAVS